MPQLSFSFLATSNIAHSTKFRFLAVPGQCGGSYGGQTLAPTLGPLFRKRGSNLAPRGLSSKRGFSSKRGVSSKRGSGPGQWSEGQTSAPKFNPLSRNGDQTLAPRGLSSKRASLVKGACLIKGAVVRGSGPGGKLWRRSLIPVSQGKLWR